MRHEAKIESVGAVFAGIRDSCTAARASGLAGKAMSSVPAGRLLVAYWTECSAWTRRRPVEAALTQRVLGSASQRTRDGWSFFGNGVCRIYGGPALGAPDTSLHWVAFQAPGERALRRRHTAKAGTLVRSELPVRHAAFTRDVANNVWHFREDDWEESFLRRFQSLVTWSDECSLLLTPEGAEIRPWAPLDLSAALIPVANKERYAWREGLTLF